MRRAVARRKEAAITPRLALAAALASLLIAGRARADSYLPLFVRPGDTLLMRGVGQNGGTVLATFIQEDAATAVHVGSAIIDGEGVYEMRLSVPRTARPGSAIVSVRCASCEKRSWSLRGLYVLASDSRVGRR